MFINPPGLAEYILLIHSDDCENGNTMILLGHCSHRFLFPQDERMKECAPLIWERSSYAGVITVTLQSLLNNAPAAPQPVQFRLLPQEMHDLHFPQISH